MRTSSLWGSNGELWEGEAGRLFDWSWAGYDSGLSEPPRPAVSKDLKADYGAAGDNFTDDANALENAIAGTPAGGVLFIPAGTYLIGAGCRCCARCSAPHEPCSAAEPRRSCD